MVASREMLDESDSTAEACPAAADSVSFRALPADWSSDSVFTVDSSDDTVTGGSDDGASG